MVTDPGFSFILLLISGGRTEDKIFCCALWNKKKSPVSGFKFLGSYEWTDQ
jgi:hypothetical protein